MVIVNRLLPEHEWKSKREEELRRLDRILDQTYRHRSRHQKHPVWDFLWEYYHFRPSKCRYWSAGVGVGLVRADPGQDVDSRHWSREGEVVVLQMEAITPERRRAAEWILNHLRCTQASAPRLSCYGFHEWAMVYRSPDRRHGQVPLRMEPEALDRAVDEQGLCCTHYDAFRFFTPAAESRNPVRLTPADRTRMEQPGCLHATMDLYKWAFKFYPFISTRLVIDGLELAVEARRLDMEASPYDLRDYGFQPLPIETPEGKVEYRRRQQQLMDRARPLRHRLINAYEDLLRCLNAVDAPDGDDNLDACQKS
jgi:hypothetical protein